LLLPRNSFAVHKHCTVRNATLLTVGSSLFAVFIVAACASSETAATQDPPKEEPTDETPNPTPPAPKVTKDASTDTAPAKQCVAKCTSDLECQNSCPAAPAGIYCCDVSAGTCYANSNSSCPVVSDGGDGGNTPAY
jgi:hypothetical protein